MKKDFSFKILARERNCLARAGVIKTAHGEIETPYLIPVATRGHVISLSAEDIKMLGVQVLLSNTYHLHFMPPGDEAIAKKGGLHKVMKFNGPLFTDSGGFQALSLGKGKVHNIRKIGFFPGKRDIERESESFVEVSEKGILFKSVYDDSKRFIGPRESMKIQSNLGSDIIMSFDLCNFAGDSKKETRDAMELSHKWELESLEHHDKKQALYGIIHGGVFKDLRIKSTKFVLSQDFDGIAIGGSLGKTKDEMYEILGWIAGMLDDRPRHLLGIGWVEDVFNGVELGMDTFDCVEMTRIARHGELYISPKSGGNCGNKFRIPVGKSMCRNDSRKVDSSCKCFTCKNYKRKDLHKMYKAKDPEYARLATIHNIHFMTTLMASIRTAIKKGKFLNLKREWFGRLCPEFQDKTKNKTEK
jgi:queuine tRNA-ribosyltransferase